MRRSDGQLGEQLHAILDGSKLDDESFRKRTEELRDQIFEWEEELNFRYVRQLERQLALHLSKSSDDCETQEAVALIHAEKKTWEDRTPSAAERVALTFLHARVLHHMGKDALRMFREALDLEKQLGTQPGAFAWAHLHYLAAWADQGASKEELRGYLRSVILPTTEIWVEKHVAEIRSHYERFEKLLAPAGHKPRH